MEHYIRLENNTDKIRIFADGILIIEGEDYNKVISMLKDHVKVTQDDYHRTLVQLILCELTKEVA